MVKCNNCGMPLIFKGKNISGYHSSTCGILKKAKTLITSTMDCESK